MQLRTVNNYIECVALDLIERFGDRAASIARELAEIANEPHGEILSAETWIDITDAIERALREGVTGRRINDYDLTSRGSRHLHNCRPALQVVE